MTRRARQTPTAGDPVQRVLANYTAAIARASGRIVPLQRVTCPPAPRPKLGAPPPGSAATLAALLLRQRQIQVQTLPLADRAHVIRMRWKAGKLTAAAAEWELEPIATELAALHVQELNIDAEICRTRAAIRRTREARALASPDVDRIMRRLFPEDSPVIPWGYHPAPGERRKPEPPPVPERPFADRLREKVLALIEDPRPKEDPS